MADSSKYQKCVVCLFWFGRRVMVTKRLKSKFWRGYYGVVSGKLEKNEGILKGLRREIREETGLLFIPLNNDLLDVCIDDENKEKAFIFQASIHPARFADVKNLEPEKHSDWQLYTKQEALKLPLIPRIKKFIKNTKLKDLQYI